MSTLRTVLMGNGGMRVSAPFHSGLDNEESRVAALVRKSVWAIIIYEWHWYEVKIGITRHEF